MKYVTNIDSYLPPRHTRLRELVTMTFANALRCSVFILVACVLLIPTSMDAQVLYGSIVGTVADPTGAAVPSTRVVIANLATGATREANGDGEGRYSILNVPAGTYTVSINATGFRTSVREGVEVAINTVTRVDMRLEIGQVTEQVTVSATTVQLQTDKADVRTEITGQTVQSLPLPAYRNYQSLIGLVPGTSPPATQNAVVDTPGRALRSFVNGTATNNNNTLTDGAVNLNIWLPHHVAYVQPVESIETVNVTTGSMDAEQGSAGGAAITVATKSGTNALHGTGWWYHSNQHLQSDNVYFRPANFKKPLNIMNIFGGNIGGPIKKDKLFYFFNYERTTERTGYFNSYSVAPKDFRDGDFSAWANRFVIYDPASAAMNDPAGRQAFANNKVPTSRFNSTFTNIYNKMPLPNQVSVTDANNLENNFGVGAVLKLNRNQYDTKINYAMSEKVMLWGKYSRMDAPVQGKYPFGDLGGSAIGTAGIGDTTTQLVTIGFNWTKSATFLIDGVFGYTRMDQLVTIPNQDRNIGLDEWKIPGTNGGTQYASDQHYGGAPQISGLGFSDIGYVDTWTPAERHERAYTYQMNFSKVHGAHEFRWGFDLRSLQLNHWQPETANPRGNIAFAQGTTISSTQTTGLRGWANNYASALLGLVNNYGKSIQYFEMKTREPQYAFYFRDRWQANRRLTLNLGMRYEFYPLINRGDRGIERWDPYTNIVYFGGLGATPRDAGMQVSKKLFSPRVGIAFRLNDKTVIRTGYGLNYDPLPFGRPLRGLYPATVTGSWVAPVGTYGWYNNIDEGIPVVQTPDTMVRNGQGQLPTNIDMGPRSPWGGMIHRGYIQSWNFTLERQLPWEMVGSVGYVATRTIHQLLDRNINTVGPGLDTSSANRPLAQLYGRTIATNMWDGWATGKYDSLQANLQKNMSHGLFMRMSYTFGKALNYNDEDGWAGPRLWNWEGMLDRNYGPAGYDRTHSFTTGWSYELPVGQGKKWSIENKALDLFIGGWKLSGTFTAYSGLPFYIQGSGSSLLCYGCTQTADQIAEVKYLGGKGPGQLWFDPMSFRDPQWEFDKNKPTDGKPRPLSDYRAGTSGWGIMRAPGYWRINPGLYKNFKVREKYSVEFRAESNNITNSPIWNNPAAAGYQSQGMLLNSAGQLDTTKPNPLNNFGSLTSASTGREFRFGLRIAF